MAKQPTAIEQTMAETMVITIVTMADRRFTQVYATCTLKPRHEVFYTNKNAY